MLCISDIKSEGCGQHSALKVLSIFTAEQVMAAKRSTASFGTARPLPTAARVSEDYLQ